MSLRGHLRCYHGAVVGIRLIELLLGHHPLVIKSLHTVIGLLCQLLAGLSLLPHVERRLDLLHARTRQSLLIQSRCRALHSLGLTQLGIEFGRRQHIQQLSLGHMIALLDLHLLDAARNLRRSLVGCTLDRTLNYRGLRPLEVPSDKRHHGNDNYHGYNQPDNITLFHISYALSLFERNLTRIYAARI